MEPTWSVFQRISSWAGRRRAYILGKTGLIAKIKKHPLARAVRIDKINLAVLCRVLDLYLRDKTLEIPVWQYDRPELKRIWRRPRCAGRNVLGTGEIVEGLSTIGGGSLPGETLPTRLLSLKMAKLEKALSELRANDPPIIARIERDRIVCDPRTVFPQEEESLLAGLRENFFLEYPISTMNKNWEGMSMRSDLDALMKKQKIDALLVSGPTQHNASMVYFTGLAHITTAYLIKKRGKTPLLIHPPMERDEAALTGLELKSFNDYPAASFQKEAGGDTSRLAALRLKKMLMDAGITKGSLALYGQNDLGSGWSIFSRCKRKCRS